MAESTLQPTYKRQRYLLEFIRQIGSGVTSTDLQKLVFLNTMQEGLKFYEFIPYRYGAYSFQLAEDVDILRRDRFLAFESPIIVAVGNYEIKNAFPIASERGNSLIRKTYIEYPYYSINSDIARRILKKAEAETHRTLRESYRQTSQVLVTIGYEGRTVEAFVNELIRYDVRLLCDVRKNPYSRKFGFSKEKLEHVLATIGIKYIHIPELGIDSNDRKSLVSTDDYQCLFSEYKENLPANSVTLENLYSLLQSNVRVAIMCFEKTPEMCHRHIIRDFMVNKHTIRSVDL
jgi:uncharacterized protein (DUF488 family)